MRFRLTVLLLAVAVVGLVAQSAPPRIEPKDAKKFVGKVATVCGRIGSTGCKAGVTAFYFSGTSSGHVSITLPQPARPAADPRVEDRYIAQGVCVTGMVTKGSGAGEIAIDDLARITSSNRSLFRRSAHKRTTRVNPALSKPWLPVRFHPRILAMSGSNACEASFCFRQ
jgi:hypothetical protein